MNALAAENAIIATIIHNNDIKYEASVIPDDFENRLCRHLFTTMMGMEAIDVVTLNAATDNKHTMEILDISESYVTSANWKHYESIIKENAEKRRLRSMLTEQLHSVDIESSENIKTAITAFVMDRSECNDIVKASDGLHELLDDVQSGSIESDGLLTGIWQLDKILGCMAWGELYYLGARPSMGKTSLALNVIANVAEKVPVMMFALESTVRILKLRLMCILGNASMTDTLRRKNQDENIPRVVRGANILSQLPIYIDDSCGLPVEELERKLRISQKQYGIKFAVIDYLTLMTTKKRVNSKYEEVTHISKELKRIAKDLEIPALVTCQLNRGLEQRPNKRPMMSDFRDSGQIEQDAEAMITLYRDEVYNENTETPNMVEMAVLKNKNGDIGFEEAYFDKISMKFK